MKPMASNYIADDRRYMGHEQRAAEFGTCIREAHVETTEERAARHRNNDREAARAKVAAGEMTRPEARAWLRARWAK